MSELERRLLARLTYPDEMAMAWDLGLRPEVFGEPICQAIFEFMRTYWQNEHQKMPPTLGVLSQAFPGVELPINEEISTTWAVEHLKTLYANNGLQLTMVEATKIAQEDPQGAVKYLRAETHAMAEVITPRHSRSNMAENILERRQRYQERSAGDFQGVTLGVPQLDEWTNGLLPGELLVCGAYAKTGKTFFMVNAMVAARKAGLTPIIFTLEMPKEEIEDRLDSICSGLSYDRLSHAKLTIPEMKTLHAAQEGLRAMGDVLIEQPEEGDRTVGTLINRARHAGANYVFIDQLSYMEPGRRVRDLKEHHSVIMKQLKVEIGRGSAGRLPCWLNVQFNRDSQKRSDNVGLHSFANATEVEATCDLALGLSRDDDMEKDDVMRMEILGGRRSKRRAWQMKWFLTNRTHFEVDRVIEE